MSRLNAVPQAVAATIALSKQPELYVLIDISVVPFLQNNEYKDAKESTTTWMVNPKLCSFVNNLKARAQESGVIIHLLFYGKKVEVDKESIVYWDGSAANIEINLEVVLNFIDCLCNDEVERLKTDVIGFETNQNGDVEFSEEILQQKIAKSFKPERLLFLSNKTNFLNQVEMYGASIVRFAKTGEIDHSAFEQFKDVLSSNNKYALKHLCVDLDDTTIMRAITAAQLSPQLVLNPHLKDKMLELKEFKFTASVLSSRQKEFDRKIKIKNILVHFENMKNHCDNIFDDVRGIVEFFILDKKSKQKNPKTNRAIEDIYSIIKIQFSIEDLLSEIQEKLEYMDEKSEAQYNFYEKIKEVIKLLDDFYTLLCNFFILGVEWAGENQDQNALCHLRELYAELEEQVSIELEGIEKYFLYALTVSTSHIVTSVKEQWGVDLKIRDDSCLDFERSKKRKIEVIKEFVKPYVDQKQSVLIGMIDDNPQELAEAEKAIPELEAQGVKLVVISVYHSNQFYRQQFVQEESFINTLLQSCIGVHKVTKVLDRKFGSEEFNVRKFNVRIFKGLPLPCPKENEEKKDVKVQPMLRNGLTSG